MNHCNNSTVSIPIPSSGTVRRCSSADFPSHWFVPDSFDDKKEKSYTESTNLVSRVTEEILEESDTYENSANVAASYVKRYLQLNVEDDKFPVLIRQDEGFSASVVNEEKSVDEEISNEEFYQTAAYGGLVQEVSSYYDEFNQSNCSNETIDMEELDIYSLAKDYCGCKYLQKKLEVNSEAVTTLIFERVVDHLVELMTHQFGNYLCQKLLDYCTAKQRTIFVDKIASDLPMISVSTHGTRAIQKLIEMTSESEQLTLIVEALRSHVVYLIRDVNGNHVIQRCLSHFSNENKQFIYDAVTKNCMEVAAHRHGCFVLQRCIDFASGKQRKILVDEIVQNAISLVQDPYGNYVAQYVLDLGEPDLQERLINLFLDPIAQLSVQKFSSNAIEKCIRVASPIMRCKIFEAFLIDDRLERIMRDGYGNYVIQTALDFAISPWRQKFIDRIRSLLPDIKDTPHGKRLLSKLKAV